MRRGQALALACIAAALAAGAFVLLRGTQTSNVAVAGAPFVPALADRAESIGAVEAMRGNATVRLDRQADGSWVVTSNDGYPALTELVRGLVVSLGSLTLDEPMTAKPEKHGELALAWPDQTGRARRVRLLSREAGAEPLCDVVLGDERAQPDTVFVRVFDQPQCWRARGRLQLPGDALSWVDRSLLALPDEEVTSATLQGLTLTRPDGPGATGAAPPRWIPTAEAGSAWTDAQLQAAQTTLGQFLGRLEFDGVRRARVDATPEPRYSPSFQAKGASISLAGHRETDGVWFRLNVAPRDGASAEPPASKPLHGGTEVPDYAALAARVAGWEYRMPAWKADSLDRMATPGPPSPPPLAAPAPAGPAPTAPNTVQDPQK